METAKERALNFAKFWYAGGEMDGVEENERRIAGLAKEITRLLKEQDKFTRYAIAEAPVNDSRARAIAMNTREVIS